MLQMTTKTKANLGFVFLVLLVLSGCRFRQAQTSTQIFSPVIFQSRETVFNSKRLLYRLYVPGNRKENEKLPVMLYLHGSDERGDNNEGQLSGPAPLILEKPNNFQFIIVFPQCPAGRFWDKDMIEVAITELNDTVREFNGDETKLYLAGFSLGAFGTWMAAAEHPDKFAAIVPMSGRILPRSGERKDVSAEILRLADEKDPYAAYASKLNKIPIWIFHGANDPIVPVENSRQMAKALKAVGNENARFTELENTGHVSLNAAFSNPELFKWLAEQHISNK